MQTPQPLILGIGGSTKPDSTTERALKVALRAAEDAGAQTAIVAGPELVLPMYSPDSGERTPGALRMVDYFRRCHGVIIASPAYHGSLSGLIKNALDYTEDLRADGRVYFDGCAVGLIACAGGWQAAGQTLAALRSIAHALRGWPTPLAAALNTSTKMFESDGSCVDLSAKFQLETVGRQVVDFAKKQLAYERVA